MSEGSAEHEAGRRGLASDARDLGVPGRGGRGGRGVRGLSWPVAALAGFAASARERRAVLVRDLAWADEYIDLIERL